MTRTLHAAPVVLPVSASPIEDGGVLIEGDRVLDVGVRRALAHAADEIRDWPGVLLPGLVNAHTHLQYTHFADLAASGLPFPEWLATLTARRRTFDEDAWEASAAAGLVELLATGTTCAADVVTDAVALGPPAAARLAGVSYLEVVGADGAGWARRKRDALLDDLAAPPFGRAVGVSPHTLYTLGTAVFRDCLVIARERGLRTHSHLAETTDEVEYVLAGGGRLADVARSMGLDFELAGSGGAGISPVRQLEELGGLAPDVHVAHGVHVDAADRALLRDRGVVVALCARSNGALGAGEPPVAAYLAEGSRLAVGTDSRASVPDLDLLAELRALRDLALRQGAPGNDLAQRLVEAATMGGAAALGLADVGQLRPGARADLAAFAVPLDAGGSAYDVLVAHGAGRCVGTVLAGRVVHEGVHG